MRRAYGVLLQGVACAEVSRGGPDERGEESPGGQAAGCRRGVSRDSQRPLGAVKSLVMAFTSAVMKEVITAALTGLVMLQMGERCPCSPRGPGLRLHQLSS